MNQLLLLSGNPKRRRRGKRRSAAQRAATARMLAARGNPRKRRGKRRGRRSGGAVTHRRRRRGGGRGLFAGLRSSGGSVMPMLKSGVIGGAGALGVDIAMGYALPLLPASMQSSINADGSANLGYYGAKAAIAIGIGLYGRRLPVIGGYAPAIAQGALTVMSYQLLRGFVPAGVSLGFFNPAPAMSSRGMGKILSSGVGKIVSLPSAGGAGTQVARQLNALNRGR